MTVATENCATGFFGDGANKDFAFAFLIQDSASLKVYLNGVLLAGGTYTASGLDNPAGGSIHYPVSGAAIGVSDFLEIVRDVPYTQVSTFSSQGSFDPASLEGALDQLALQVQQLALGRLLRYATVDLPSPAAKGQLVFDLTLGVPVYSNGTAWTAL